VIALSNKHGITEVLPIVIAQRGWVLAQEGRYQEGVAQIQEVVSSLRATGASLVMTYVLNLLADACTQMEFDDRRRVLMAATTALKRLEGRPLQAETLRHNGELLRMQNDSSTAEAHSCFERAIAVARKQSAKSWELRATTSLARLLDKQGRREEARALLAAIYDWFTEGFDTGDLKDARRLLEELST